MVRRLAFDSAEPAQKLRQSGSPPLGGSRGRGAFATSASSGSASLGSQRAGCETVSRSVQQLSAAWPAAERSQVSNAELAHCELPRNTMLPLDRSSLSLSLGVSL
eukprot:scaffold53827_cov28-Tisochrysis_lutea.AAC.5